MDSERLRKVFGRFGDVAGPLAEMFGSSYLDHPDDTQNLSGEFDLPGHEVRGNLGPLIERKVEETPAITCQRNREILREHLIFVQTRGEEGRCMDDDEVWETSVHSRTCPEYECEDTYLKVCFSVR